MWRWLLSGVAMVNAGWGGSRGQRSLFVCLFCSVSFYGKQTGSAHNDAQYIQSHHSSCVRSGAWVIKVKSGHDCRSRYRPTFQVHHLPVIRSTNTAGEQSKTYSILSGNIKPITSKNLVIQPVPSRLCKMG